MAHRKRTLRMMSPTARKVARLIGELESVARRLNNLIPDLQTLDAECKALATAKQNSPAWLNAQVLTEALTDELMDFGLEATPGNLSKLWDNFVSTELDEGLKGVLLYSPEFQDNRRR